MLIIQACSNSGQSTPLFRERPRCPGTYNAGVTDWRQAMQIGHGSPNSIDEAFLNLAGFADPEAHSRVMRATVLQWTGIPVSVGIAPTKVLAKVANRLSKKDPASGGVMMLADEAAQMAALAKLELTDVWGIANRTAARLVDMGIRTPLELRDADPRQIRTAFNVVTERLVLKLQGVSCLSLEEHSPDRQNIMASRSFGRPVEDLDEMREAAAAYMSRAAEKIRRQGLVTAAITVFVNTNRFRVEDAQYYGTQTVRLPVATADTAKLIGRPTKASGASGGPASATRKPASCAWTCTEPTPCKTAYFTSPTIPAESS